MVLLIYMLEPAQFWHILFVVFHQNTPEEERERILQLHKALGEKCGGAKAGIVMWKVEKNLDTRKGIHIIQMSIFKNKEAFENFRGHEAHKDFAQGFSKVADWIVGDFILD